VASDPNGDPLTYHLDAFPAGMTIDARGLITWIPQADQLGPKDAKLRVDDGRGGVATQDFTINVSTAAGNGAPTIVSSPALSGQAGKPYRYDAMARDPDGDPVVWSLETSPAGLSIDPASGAVRWTPTSSQLGAQRVVIQAVDAQGGTATQSFTITVRALNTPPAITSTPPTQAFAGSPYQYAVRATDVDGDPLTFSLAGPPSMTIDAATGLIRWTPTAADVAIHEITILVNDGQATGRQVFDLDVSSTAYDGPPVITSTPAFVATVDDSYTYQVTASDPEGQALAYSLLAAPAGMTISAANGLIQWTPTSGQLGRPHTITVVASDPAGNVAGQRFTITVLGPNRAPRIDSSPVLVAVPGATYRYDVRASDPDGEPLRFTLATAPDGMIIDPALGRITWAPGVSATGSVPVVVTVSDPRGLSASQPFDLTLRADTEAPRVNLTLNASPARIGSTVTILVAATDNVGVQSLSLAIDGQPVVLDANGRATVPAGAVGSHVVLARALDAAGNAGQATTNLLVTDPSDASPPVAEITTPVDDQVITSFLNVIGTANDANLISWTLDVAPIGSGAFTVIARGTTPVVNGTLGRFDPSMLANDSYILRLTATDIGGNTSVDERTISVAGDLKLGNFTLSFTDLSIPVSGIPIAVARTYDTLNAATSDDFGFGWRLEFADTDLRTSVPRTGMEADGLFNAFRDKTRVYVTLPGGRREGFTFQPRPAPGLKGSFLGIYQAQFVPDAGVTSTLSVDSFDLTRFSDGSYGDYAGDLPYNPADPAFGGKFTVTTKEGITYKIDGRNGDLISVADRNGNALEFRSDGIFSGSGEKVTFERDPQGRITAVVDPSGQKIRYAYDIKGDLVSVTDRANNKTQFVYRTDRAHYLDRVIDPLGRTGIRSMYDDQGRLSRVIDADGHEVQLVHDPDHFTETTYDQLGNPTVYEYDERGNVLTEVDALGGVTKRTYDANNNMLTETDPPGHTKTFTYDAAGNVLTETDSLGKITRNTYDSFGNVLSTTDPLGNTTTNTLDAKGNLLEMKDAAGKVTKFAYSAAGNPTSMTDSAGTLFQFEYDAAGNVTRRVDALGHATTSTYDASGRPLTETTIVSGRTLVTTTSYDAEGRVIAVQDAEGNTTRTEYDAVGNRTATIDALGRRTEFRYDDRGLLVETIYPDATPATLADNPRTKTEYDAAGHVIAQIDEAGRRTEMKYDKLGRVIETIYPDATPADLSDNPRTKTEYDAAGQVIAQIDERSNRTEFDYDAAGRQIVVRDALGRETKTTYDDSGRSVASTDALGHTTRFVYDAAGRQVQTLFVDGTSTSTAYDSRGRVSARTDQLGRTTRYEYDAADHLTAVVDALGQRTEYTYDEAGNLISQRDANGHGTHYEYDGLNRRTATLLPLGQRSTMAYDAVGNVASTTDFNGATITFNYDARNRLTAQHLPDSTSTQFTYTPTGQRATVIDSRGTTSYQYDARDRLLSRTDPDGRTISYTYDQGGNRTSVVVPSGTITYTFDALNRTATVTDPSLGVTRYTYDAVGDLVRTELPNGTTETRQYDSLNRLTFLENRGPSGVISSYRYTLAATGRRDAVVEDTGRKVDYKYDLLDRLIDEVITDSTAGNRTIHYAYDPFGNRLSRTDSAEGQTTYTYDANDRLLTEMLGAQTTQYTYDANGNTKSKITSAVDQALYDWDVQNRLIGATVTDSSGTKHVAYKYDADGIRVSSTIGGAETRYLIDTVLPYVQVLLEYRPSGLIVASYVYGNGLIEQDRGGVLSYYQKDGLASTRALTNASGVVTDGYVYDAFGRTIGQTGNTGNVYLFAGEQRDSATGLDYLRARYLNTAAGRFVAWDSFQGLLRIPVTLHRYVYGNGNPVNVIDPRGHLGLLDVGLATISIAEVQLATSLISIGFGLTEPIKWHAELYAASVNIPVNPLVPPFGAGGAILTVESDPVQTSPGVVKRHNGAYIIPQFGVSIGPLPGSLSYTTGELTTPGFIGLGSLWPLAFTGGVLFFNAGSNIPFLQSGSGKSLTYASIGFGLGDFSGSFTGIDISLDLLLGWSEPIPGSFYDS
jgi:RHS repeat-associated protein